MPVKAFIGLQRQGKTYSCMKYAVLPQLRAGRKVISNIAFKQKAFDEFPNLEYQKEIDYENLQAGAFYAIDEIWNDCPKGVTTVKLSSKFKEFFAMSGHLVGDDGLTTEIIIITQNFETQICDYILGQIERTYYVEKIPLTDKTNMCHTTEYKGVVKGNPPRGKNEGTKKEKYDSEVFEYYKTNSGAKDGQIAIEMDVIKPKKLTDLKSFKFLVFVLPILVIALIYFAPSVFEGVIHKDKQEQQHKKNQPLEIDTINSSTAVVSSPVSVKSSIDYPLSSYMRITSVFSFTLNNITTEFVQLRIRQSYTLNIPFSSLEHDEFGDMYLIYQNQRVTRYSGELEDQDYSMLPDGRSLADVYGTDQATQKARR